MNSLSYICLTKTNLNIKKMENTETTDSGNINMENPFEAQPAISLGKNALTYGAILGGISIVYSLILWILGQTFNKPLGYVAFIFVIGLMFWGTKEYRDKHLGGYISYNKAFASNFQIGLYSFIISAIYMFVLYTVIDPSLLVTMRQMGIDAALAKNPSLTQEQIEQGMDKMKFFMSPVFYSIIAVVGGALVSLVLALIIAIFQKKEKPLF